MPTYAAAPPRRPSDEAEADAADSPGARTVADKAAQRERRRAFSRLARCVFCGALVLRPLRHPPLNLWWIYDYRGAENYSGHAPKRRGCPSLRRLRTMRSDAEVLALPQNLVL